MALDTDETVTVAIEADTSALTRALGETDRMAQGLGRSLTSALTGAAVRGRSLDDVLRGLATRLSDIALRAAMKPLESGIASLLGGLTGAAGGGATLFAKGGVVPKVTPFAQGGVLAAPAYFPMGNAGLGLAGEAGAEAILPLARGSDGRLGVRGGDGRAVSVTVNIATPDVEGFRRSEAQVSAALARAVGRGRRGL